MKIISWNVNGIRAWQKKGYFDWFLKESPDILCLQETKAHPEQLSQEMLNPQGYFVYFDHSKAKKGYSGVAVYTKVKPESVEYGVGKEKYDQEGRLLLLKFKKFTLLNVYFPNGGGGPERLKYKMEFYDEFLKLIEKLTKNGEKIIFCGDVNTAHNEIDLARPKENENHTGFLRIERHWIDKVVEKGYVDIFRKLNPQKVQYSWWDMKTFARDRNIGWRIDYFFISPDLSKDVENTGILDQVYGSDHCPISLDLNI
ncbi:exodeoxyribonuclease III [Candidatus Nomurabacteria bacterium]|nr:exodeoxyribonuclease III [Candidatus Nomurabacteria bacterium]